MSRKRSLPSLSHSRIEDRFREMSPEERVNLAVEMSDAMITRTLESIMNRNPKISRTRLLEETRRKLFAGRKANLQTILRNMITFRSRVTLIMTQRNGKRTVKKTVKKPVIDEEFRRVAESLLRKDRELLERLAKI